MQFLVQRQTSMNYEIQLGNRKIGIDHAPYFIADIAANHDGNLERAKLLIELAAKSGANAAKFQHFRAKTIVSRKGFSDLGKKIAHQENWLKDVYDVYEEAQVPWEWTESLAAHARECGIDFFTAPYDLEAIDFVDRFVIAFKVGSGDIDWIEEIEYMASKKKPMLIATGASSLQDVDRAVHSMQFLNAPLVLMQCNTNYTGVIDNLKSINLNVLKQYSNRYEDIVLGLSDHTPGFVSVLGSIALGARVIEKHFTDDTTRIGPDHGFSLDPKSWREMVELSNLLFQTLGDGKKKIEQNEFDSSIVQRRALRFRNKMSAGQVINREDIIPLRPAPIGSIKPHEISEVVGKKVIKAVDGDDLVLRDNIS
jgi:sialic acid synthase SpsE